jgi:replicative DNA helicase
MKTKVLASVLAGVMSVQSVAMATSRVEAVGVAQAEAAKAEVSGLAESLKKLDDVLSDTYSNIEVRENNNKKAVMGRFFNVINIGAATTGVAVGALAAYVATGRSGKGIAMIVMGSVGAGLTAVSAISGGLGDLTRSRNTLSVDEADLLLEKSVGGLSEIISSPGTEQVKSSAQQLRENLNELRKTLAAFKEDESDDMKIRISRELTQAAGVALIVAGMSTNGGGATAERLLVLGSVIMSAGNIATALSMMGEEQAELVLKEIKSTRAVVQMAQGQLK